MMPAWRDLFLKTYAAFNARDIDAALSGMHQNVEWPNGMEGGYVHGHDGIREYWTRQWQVLDPTVDPVRIELDSDGRVVVDVHQVVRDLSGTILLDRMVKHVYSMQDGLVMTMTIEEPAAPHA